MIARLARATVVCAAAALSGYGCDAPERHADAAPAAPRAVVVAGGDVDTTTAAGRAARSARAAASVDPGEVSSLGRGMIVPVVGTPTAALRDVFTDARGRRVHEAIDIMAPRGTPVVSALDGKLTKLHTSKAGGLMVYAADPSDRFVLLYAHLDRYAAGLVEGAPIHRGQLLGYVGSTGNANPNAPHLHFAVLRGQPSEAWWKGTPVNPYPLLVGGVTLAELPAEERERAAPVSQAATAEMERGVRSVRSAPVAMSDDFAPAAAEAEGTAMLVPMRGADSATSKRLATAEPRATSRSKAAADAKLAKAKAPVKASRTKASSVKASAAKTSSAKQRGTVSATRAKRTAATTASKKRTPND
jgi:peptidoglycan LD-endopeptidase LytH